MLLSISEAAKTVGIKSRSTFYRHIEKKGISLIKDDDGNPKVDISELIRVYGSKVKMPEEGTEQNTPDTPKTIQAKQDNTPPQIGAELQVLRERLKNLEENKKSTEEERRKEREQLIEQIETLRNALHQSQDQQKRLTLLITDQSDGKKAKEDLHEQRIKNLESVITNLQAQNDRFFKLEEERKKRSEERREEKQKQLEEEKRLEEEKNKGFWSKLFG